VRVTGDGLSSDDKGTYPKPMFDFSHRRNVCLSAMKTAYDVGLHGNDEKVLDGTWRELFPSPDESEVRGECESDDGERADEGDEGPDAETGDKRRHSKDGTDGAAKKQKK